MSLRERVEAMPGGPEALERARRRRNGRLKIYIEPRDIWVGVYVAPKAVYVCPLPLLVFRWRRSTANCEQRRTGD